MVNFKKVGRKILAPVISMTIVAGTLCMPSQPYIAKAAGTESGASVIDSYLKPGDASKLMARFWFPDAGAGYDKDGDGRGDYIDMVSEMVQDMIDEGFGGCELTMLLDNADSALLDDVEYNQLGFQDTYDASSKIGWGSEAWANIIACAADTANNSGTDFMVDVTVTAHWPMIINNIDPNDDAQQQEIVYTTQKITNDMLTADSVKLELPTMKTADNKSGTFIFKDTLVSATVAKISNIQEDYSGTVTVVSGSAVTVASGSAINVVSGAAFSTMTDASAYVNDGTAAWSAGVPKGKDANGNDFIAMKLNGNQWDFYTKDTLLSTFDLQPANDVIILEKGTHKQMKDVTVIATTSMFGTRYTVTDASGNNVSNFDTISKGTLVKVVQGGNDTYYYDDEMPDGLITINKRSLFGYNTESYTTARSEMDDTQLIYSISGSDLSKVYDKAKEGDSEGGDYYIISTYRRGTGQVSSGGSNYAMAGKTYAVDYFNSDGAQAVINYWNNNLLNHEYTRADGTKATLKSIMQENGGCIFEDSIELSHSSPLWSKDLISDINNFVNKNTSRTSYDITKYVPIIAGLTVYGDNGEADRLEEDYKQTLSYQYSEEHLKTLKEWTSSFGYKLRTQCHGIDAVDAGEAALSTDIAESDNATDGYGSRVYAGVNNIQSDKNVVSNESLTFGKGFGQYPSWYYAVNTINRYYSEGINRIILHGTPFKKSYTSTTNSTWPGWFFTGFMSWNDRQTWWDDVDIMTDYTDRIQAILQNGQSKIPVAILVDPAISNITSINSGVSLSKKVLQEIIGDGNNYNIITKGLLEGSDNMTIVANSLSGKVVLSPTAEYQVLVLSDISCMSVAAMQKIVDYAKTGLCIVDVGSNIAKIYGSDVSGTGDGQIQALYAELKNCDSYYAAADEEDMRTYIDKNVYSGVNFTNAVSTAASATNPGSKWLETTRLYDSKDGSNYYMFYNESAISVGAEQDKAFGPEYWNENGDITTTVTLEGTGVPYKLDPVDGSITAISGYTKSNGKVTFNMSIQEGDLFFVVVSDNSTISSKAKTEPAKTQKSTIELGGDTQWNLDLTSYTEDSTPQNTATLFGKEVRIDPTKSLKNTVSLKTKLLEWKQINFSDAQLAALNVKAKNRISGIGVYTVEVNVPSYSGQTGAVLNYDYDKLCNNLTGITVTNATGKTTTIKANNANHDYLDLGTVLSSGKNTITIELCTELSAATGNDVISGSGAVQYTADILYGLTDASIDLYTVNNSVPSEGGSGSASNNNATPTVTPTPVKDDGKISTAPVTGIRQDDGTFKDASGNKITSSIVVTADSTKYIVDENGAVIKSTIVTTEDGSSYYATQSGVVAIKQLITVDGKKYYAGDDGQLVSSKLITVDGKKYYADKTGVIVTKKFVTVNEKKYYAGNTGVIATKKFITVNEKKYYAGTTGVIATKKFITVNEKKYYTGNTGVIATKKFITVNERKYYATKSGELAVSTWIKVGGKSYYCNKNGVITKFK